jgi:hypothetical protein
VSVNVSTSVPVEIRCTWTWKGTSLPVVPSPVIASNTDVPEKEVGSSWQCVTVNELVAPPTITTPVPGRDAGGMSGAVTSVGAAVTPSDAPSSASSPPSPEHAATSARNARGRTDRVAMARRGYKAATPG